MRRFQTFAMLAALFIATTVLAQTPATPPLPSPVSGIRNKIAAGDLLSAESILEMYRAKNGEDGSYLVGLSWLARGAFLMGEFGKARAYTAIVRTGAESCAATRRRD